MKCLGCFAEIGEAEICPQCGLDSQAEEKKRKEKNALPGHEILLGRYYLGKLLGAGGFGITYLALDLQEDKLVAIKEFFSAQQCQRREDGHVIPTRSQHSYEKNVNSFYEEAKILHKLDKCRYVVEVQGFYRANNTAYIVMEYLSGQDLRDYTKQEGGILPLEKAKDVVLCIALALGMVHQKGVIHCDISPANILMDGDDVKLIDFGASKMAQQGGSDGVTVQLKPGFAPPEQYPGSKEKMGAWTDVYALACTFYRIVTGHNVPAADQRVKGAPVPPISDYVSGVDYHLVATIEKAMALDVKKRYQNMDSFIEDFVEYKETQQAEIPANNTPAKSGGWLKGLKFALGRNQSQQQQQIQQQVQQQPQYEAYVEVLEGYNAGTRLFLESGRKYLIGRQFRVCDLVVSDKPTISRTHCSLTYDRAGRTVLVEDSSVNGTSLEGGHTLIRSSAFVNKSCMISLADGDVVLKIVMV